jgi:putative peptidoglycan lipid II flippase
MDALVKEVDAPVERHGEGKPEREGLATVARRSRIVAVWILVSRITGFGRVVVAAAVLGPTFFGNLFQLTNSIPSLIFGLLSGSLLSAMLVPPLVRCIDARDPAAARRLANGVLGVIMALCLAVTIIGLLFAPLLLWLLTTAVQDPDIRREQMRLGWPLLAVILPQLLCYAVSGVGAAVQQAHGRFALAAAAPAVDNLGAIAVLGAFAVLHGSGGDIHAIGEGAALLLGLGTTAAVALCAALQWWGARRMGLRLAPWPGWRQPEIRDMVRMGVSSVGYTSLSISAYFGMLVIASGVAGGVATFQIANSFIQLPIALTAGSLAAVHLPHLSRYVHEGRLGDFGMAYGSAMGLVVFAMLPASLLLVVIPDVLAQAVAFGKMAAPAGVALLAACIAARGLGAIGEAVVMLGTSASYARRDTASPLRAMLLLAAISVAGIALARAMSDPVTVIWVLGGTATVAHSAAALYLHLRQMRGMPPGTGFDRRNGAVNLLAAVVAMVPAWLVGHYVGGAADGAFGRIQIAGAAALAAIATYMVLQFIRDSKDMMLLLPSLAQLRQGRRLRDLM